ncbi:MAG: hypothetical protein ACXAAI_09705 [Promethearchaeota archaeon]|jgi:hypothetical protein
MNPQEFRKKLNEVRELMAQEQYKEALNLLEKLKKDEANSESDFNYNLIHELYQLDSNCKSALHQQLILERLLNISNNEKRISFKELNEDIKKNLDLNISEEILRREVELLILRNLISCRIEETTIVF